MDEEPRLPDEYDGEVDGVAAVKDATSASTGLAHSVLKELLSQGVIAKDEGMKPTTYRPAARSNHRHDR